jgi:hypothetical protein
MYQSHLPQIFQNLTRIPLSRVLTTISLHRYAKLLSKGFSGELNPRESHLYCVGNTVNVAPVLRP